MGVSRLEGLIKTLGQSMKTTHINTSGYEISECWGQWNSLKCPGRKKKGNIEKDQNDFGFLNSNIVSEVNIAVPS